MRDAVKGFGVALQESYRQKAYSYIKFVTGLKKGIKTLDEALVKLGKPKE